jgi:hypothetical protein
MIVSAMGEDVTSDTPDQAELQAWADRYELTTPVIADDGWSLLKRYSKAQSYPRYTLLGPGAEVIFVNQKTYSESEIEAVLPY